MVAVDIETITFLLDGFKNHVSHGREVDSQFMKTASRHSPFEIHNLEVDATIILERYGLGGLARMPVADIFYRL